MSSLTINWVDFLVVLLLGVGLWRGRKRGTTRKSTQLIVNELMIAVIQCPFLGRPVSFRSRNAPAEPSQAVLNET